MAFEETKANKDDGFAMLVRDDVPLIETDDVPKIYADGVAAVEIHGTNVRITFFELQMLNNEEVRVPILVMTRPLHSCARGSLATLIERAQMRKDVCRHH